MTLRLVLVDDHVLVRSALSAVLSREPDFVVVGEAGDAKSALELLAANRPDVALVDIAMPGESGLDLVRAATRAVPQTKIVVLTMFGTRENAREAIEAGAAGFATKAQTLRDLAVAIRAVAAGTEYVPDDLAGERSRADKRLQGVSALSAREKEILAMVVAGKGTKQIAGALFISVKTVESHRCSINRKLGVHSVGELMRFAAAQGRMVS